MARAEVGECVRASGFDQVGWRNPSPILRIDGLLTAERPTPGGPGLIIASCSPSASARWCRLDHHRQAIAEATHDIDNVADLSQSVLTRRRTPKRATPRGRPAGARALDPAPRPSAAASFSATPMASSPRPPPRRPRSARAWFDVLGETQPLTSSRQRGRPRDRARRRSQAFATVRTLAVTRGQLSVFQLRKRRAGALALRHHADRHAHGHQPVSCC